MLTSGFKFLALAVCASILPSPASSSPILPRQWASLEVAYAAIAPSTVLTWHSCLTDTTLWCAVLDVPLDYANPSGPRAKLPLIKYPATTTPYKGMVFVNPGGPGASAVDDVRDNGAWYAGVVGTNYDIVAYEPRGIRYSTPSATCAPLGLKKRIANLPYGPRLPSEFYQEAFTFGQSVGTACSAAIGGPNDAGKYMSSAVVARDAISVLDAYAASGHSNGVANKTLFNFWGFSYGTIVGQTFAMLFPARVGRFVLDGVVDAEDWYSGTGEKAYYLADVAFSSYFSYCSLAGSVCSFNTGSDSSQAIFQRFENMVLKLDVKKAMQENWANKTELFNVLTSLKIGAISTAAQPIWYAPSFGNALFAYEQYVNGAWSYATTAGAVINYHVLDQRPSWTAGVLCSDTGNVLFGKTLAQLQPKITKSENQSCISGELFAIPKAFTCTTWSIPGVGRYTGGFGGNTQTPILFVSNTVDPVTPILNGAKAQFIFNKAKLLTIDAFGHTSGEYSVNNPCAKIKIGAYFQGGAPSNSFCAAAPGAFGLTVSTSSVILKRDESLFSKKSPSIYDE